METDFRRTDRLGLDLSELKPIRRLRAEDIRIAAFEPNRKFAAEATNGRAKGTRISYFMEPVEDGKTKLSRVTEAQLHGLAKLLQPVLAPITRWTAGMEANNVKRILEGYAL